MFSVDKIFRDGFEIWQLSDGEGCVASLVPECGGILNAFSIMHHGGKLNIIDGYSSKAEFEAAAESKGFKSCKLSPYVCRLKKGEYKFAEKEYKVEGFYLGDHALHGLLYRAAFEVQSHKANEDGAEIELLYQYKKEVEGYPFSYDCRLVYELKKDNTLNIRTIIKNQTDLAIPMSDGWHPYFSFGGSINNLMLQFNSHQMLEFDAELVPTGKKLPFTDFAKLRQIADTRLDNSFLVDQDVIGPALTLRDEEKKLQLEINCDKLYPILQIYTPDHRQSIAIENLSAAPDAFNNGIGLTVIPAGKEVTYTTSYTIRNI